MPRTFRLALLALSLGACGRGSPPPATPPQGAPPPTAPTTASEPPSPAPTSTPAERDEFAASAPSRCGGEPLTVRVINVGQALSVLLDLPGGRHVLVDTGDSRVGTQAAHKHLMEVLKSDLGDAPIDLLWITHQHADHIGGAKDVLATFKVLHYVDNGTVPDDPEIKRVHDEANKNSVATTVVDQSSHELPLHDLGSVKLTAIAPSQFSSECSRKGGDRNLCSIMLRLDYCTSSVLLTGDEEQPEEADFPQLQPVTLLQAGHHGSKTSSGPGFIQALRPTYVVISAGPPEEGLNETYCHPSAETVQALTTALGGADGKGLLVFDTSNDQPPCNPPNHGPRTPAWLKRHMKQWIDVPTNKNLWATERDGDVTVVTNGDGTFRRE